MEYTFPYQLVSGFRLNVFDVIIMKKRDLYKCNTKTKLAYLTTLCNLNHQLYITGLLY